MHKETTETVEWSSVEAKTPEGKAEISMVKSDKQKNKESN